MAGQFSFKKNNNDYYYDLATVMNNRYASDVTSIISHNTFSKLFLNQSLNFQIRVVIPPNWFPYSPTRGTQIKPDGNIGLILNAESWDWNSVCTFTGHYYFQDSAGYDNEILITLRLTEDYNNQKVYLSTRLYLIDEQIAPE